MKILIAEDDELLRALLTDFVTELGHETRSAPNGEELVKMALSDRPDLIITDLHMPLMSGSSMIAMMDMYPALAGIAVMIISGASAAELADMGIPREIPVLPKPFDFGRIAREISRFDGRPRR
ncbi:MAG: response regulator [Elusimicrobia bacterium]|nr:response regulator [Elusimicrobiota bacterium]